MRLLICAGGTGGGVYPALAVLQALEDNPDVASNLSVLWVGSESGMEKDLVERVGVKFEGIPAAGVHGVGLLALPGNILRLIRGFFRSKVLLNQFKPQALFFTGGYVSVPVALAGKIFPSLVYIPDIEPGLALKFLSHFARRIAVSVEDSIKYFKEKTKLFVSGYPTRKELNCLSKEAALDHFGLIPNLPVLLVFGGSSGARSINRALVAALPRLLQEMQVVHITGRLDWEETQKMREEFSHHPDLQAAIENRYLVFPYLHDEMGAAFCAADLVVSRAGASILGELPLFGLPAILVPYPHAWRYQQVNAKYLADKGAAIILDDHDLENQMADQVLTLMRDRKALNRLQQAMSELKRPDAADKIAQALIQVALEPNQQGDRS